MEICQPLNRKILILILLGLIARDKNEKKLIGFSYLRLVDEEGRTVQDKSHSLSVFRCDDILRIANVAAYLSQSAEEEKLGREVEDKRKGNGFLIRSGKERVQIKTLLCSTKLTQNGLWIQVLVNHFLIQ